MASQDNSSDSSDPSGKTPLLRTKAKSKKLDRTLKELESAFGDWESLNGEPGAEPVTSTSPDLETKTQDPNATESEFRKKTKKLLHDLREQLAELND